MTSKTTITRSFLFTLMLVSLFSTAAAYGYDNIGNRYGIDTTTGPYNTQNPFCTSGLCNHSEAFAWGRALDHLGIQISQRGIACSWWNNQDAHYSKHLVDEPRTNSLAIWQDSSGLCNSSHPGHVAYVEEVDGDYVFVNEANWEAPGFNGQTKRFTKSELLNRNGYTLKGYLYLDSPFSYYSDWDFNNQGTAGWDSGNVLTQGTYSDGTGSYWRLGSYLHDTYRDTPVRQIFSPLLNDIYTDKFNAIEITFKEDGSILNSINGWFRIDDTWYGPVSIPWASGPGTSGSLNSYKCSIPLSYSGQIQQVRFDFDSGSDNISIYGVSFDYTDNVPSSGIYSLSGYITDPNSSATEWHVVATPRDTSRINLGNTANTNSHLYTMALLLGHYDIACESYIYVDNCEITVTVTADNFEFTQYNNVLDFTIPLSNSPYRHITGYVKDDQGRGIPSVIVSATSIALETGLDEKCISSTATSSDDLNRGFFDLTVIPGTYDILFSAPNGTPSYLNKSVTLTDVISDTPLGDIVLTSLVKYFLSGYFMDENGIHTLDGYNSALIYADNPSIDNFVWTETTDGNFIFNLFVKGSYNVNGYYDISAVMNNDYNNGNSQTSTSTTYQLFDYILMPDTIGILLPSYDYYFLDGIVTDMKGIPLSGVRMDVSGPDGRCRGWGYSDSHGYYSLRLIPGQYSILVTPTSGTYPPFQINIISITGDCQRNIRLSSDYAILDTAINQIELDALDIALDVLDIINQGNTLSYDFEVTGSRNTLEIIPNWTGSGISVEVINPAGISAGIYTSPTKITITNPTPGTWICRVSAGVIPHSNYPFALATGLSQNQEPIAEASGPYSGYINTGIVFDAGTSIDHDGTIIRYEWDWNNDGIYEQSSTTSTISHTWIAPYNGTVRLRVTDDSGLDSTDTCSVNVSTQPPGPPATVTYTLKASVSSGNGTIQPSSGTYNQGTVINLKATPGPGYQIKAWHGTNNDSSKSTTNTVTMNSNRTVTVEFELIPAPTTFTLNASVSSGNGTVKPASGTYSQGTVVSLTATPGSGYEVKAWHGTDNDSSMSTTNSVIMSADRTVTVEFELIQYSLNASVSSGNGTLLPVSGPYTQGTVVSISATPGSGYRVKAWHGTDHDSSKSTTNSVTMSANRTVTVEFELISSLSYTLNASVVNGHGTVTVSPSPGPYSQGTKVSLSATPESGYKVKAWTGTDDDTSTADSNTITMNADHTTTVEFVSITNSDTGNGGGGGGGSMISTCVSDPLSLWITPLVILLGIVLRAVCIFTQTPEDLIPYHFI